MAARRGGAAALVVREGHMFASPVAPPVVLPSRDVFLFLRLITSSACRNEKRVPFLAMAAMYGVSRLALYRMPLTGRARDDTAKLTCRGTMSENGPVTLDSCRLDCIARVGSSGPIRDMALPAASSDPCLPTPSVKPMRRNFDDGLVHVELVTFLEADCQIFSLVGLFGVAVHLL
jgi:hypothetical protein